MPPRDHLVARRLGDEMVIVNLETSAVFTVNETGARVFELVQAGADRAALRARLSAEFDFAEADLDEEIDRALTTLRVVGLEPVP